MDHPVKVWLGGEGPSEIGNRGAPEVLPGEERVGAIEALLRRIEPEGWRVEGASQWVALRKYDVGAAIGHTGHGDEKNVLRLVNRAFESACEAVAFTRDVDADLPRVEAIARAIDKARRIFPHVDIIGGTARPSLEGWILALLGVRDTESMSRARCNALLAARGLDGKQAEDYVGVVEAAELGAGKLPPGCDAMCAWLDVARDVLGRAVRGTDVSER